MKTKIILAALFLITPLFASASSVTCKVVSAKAGSVYTKFVGGKIQIDGDNGSTVFSNVADNAPVELQVISETLVSSFNVDRKACYSNTETVVNHDGDLRGKIFNFKDCTHRKPDGTFIAYVHANVGFDLDYKSGSYNEISLMQVGPAVSASVQFEECVLR